MKKDRLMILLLGAILVSPSLLFAEKDWTTDIVGSAVGAVTGTAGAVSGALSTGYNTYIAPSLTVNNAVNIAASNPLVMGAGAAYKIVSDPVGSYNAGISGATAAWVGTQKFYSDLTTPVTGAVSKFASDPIGSFSAGVSGISGAAAAYLPLDSKITANNNWSPSATKGVVGADFGNGSYPYDAGKAVMGSFTNGSNLNNKQYQAVNP